jgi:hypothetical protein
MDKDRMELAARAIAELAPLGNRLGLRSAMQVAETDGLAANMLTALLGHELVAGHATMMKLSAKIDRWLALVADDRLTEDQERGTREAVRLAIAASRLTERYRAGLLSLARLRGWDSGRPAGASAAASRRIDPADLLAAFGDDDDLDDGPDDGPGDGPKGGTRALVQALQQMRAVNSQLSAPLGNGHANGAKPNGAPKPNGAHTPSAPHANRDTLRHGQPLGRFPRRPALRRPHARRLPCRQPAMGNGRCRLHGGKSTGARTAAGLARVRANRLVHGARTAEIVELRSAAARHGCNLRALARLANAAEAQSERSTPCPATKPRRVARG